MVKLFFDLQSGQFILMITLNAYCVEDRADSFTVFSIKELVYYRPNGKQFSNESNEKKIALCRIVTFSNLSF